LQGEQQQKISHFAIPTVFLHCITWNDSNLQRTLGVYFYEGKYWYMKWWKICHIAPSSWSNTDTTLLHISCIYLLKTTWH